MGRNTLAAMDGTAILTRIVAERLTGNDRPTAGELRDAVLNAAAEIGEDGNGKDKVAGYLRYLAKSQPAAFATLLSGVLGAASER